MSTPCRFRSHADAVKAGWFSRRHETRDAHYAAQDARRKKMDARREREQASLKK